MKRFLVSCALLLVALVPAARANSFTVDEVSVTPSQIVGIAVDGFWSGKVYAGINNLIADGQPMQGFCIDPFHFSQHSSPGYEFVPLEDAPKPDSNNMGAVKAGEISDLWALYYSGSMNANDAAGLQIAIWMIVGGSKFHLTSGDDYGAGAMISSLAGYFGPGANLIGLSGPGQDYVVPTSPVPEGGATVCLLGGSLAALAVFRKVSTIFCPVTGS